MGAAGGLMVGVGGVVGVVGRPWGWMGLLHISQWSACHSGWEIVLGNVVSVSSGSVGIMRHRCSRGAIRRCGQAGVGVGSWVVLGAEGVQGGLVAGGQGWVVGFVGVAFGMSGT